MLHKIRDFEISNYANEEEMLCLETLSQHVKVTYYPLNNCDMHRWILKLFTKCVFQVEMICFI